MKQGRRFNRIELVKTTTKITSYLVYSPHASPSHPRSDQTKAEAPRNNPSQTLPPPAPLEAQTAPHSSPASQTAPIPESHHSHPTTHTKYRQQTHVSREDTKNFIPPSRRQRATPSTPHITHTTPTTRQKTPQHDHTSFFGFPLPNNPPRKPMACTWN